MKLCENVSTRINWAPICDEPKINAPQKCNISSTADVSSVDDNDDDAGVVLIPEWILT